MKCGMTHTWSKWGQHIPLTIVEIQDCQVTHVRTGDKDGITAMELGAGWQKRKRLNVSQIRHFESKSLPLKRYLRQFKVTEDALLPVGTSITASHYVPGQYVDVQGVTKGHGFQGVMKRWGFAGGPASHGVSLAHRTPGSMGGAAGSRYATRVFPGKKMPGRMGGKRQTMLSLMIYKIDRRHNLLYLKGTVPGVKGGFIRINDTKNLSKSWMHPKAALPSPPPFPTFLPQDHVDGMEDVVFAPEPEVDPLYLSNA